MAKARSTVKEIGILMIGLGLIIPSVLGLYLLVGGQTFDFLGPVGLIAIGIVLGAAYVSVGIAVLKMQTRNAVIAAIVMSIVGGLSLMIFGRLAFLVGVVTIATVVIRGNVGLHEIARKIASRQPSRRGGGRRRPRRRRRPRDDDFDDFDEDDYDE